MSSMGEFTFEALAFDGESGFGEEAEARFARRFAARRSRFAPAASGPGPLRPRYPRSLRRPRWATPYPPIWLPWPLAVEPYDPLLAPLAEPAADDGTDAPEEEYAFFSPSGVLEVPFKLTPLKLIPEDKNELDMECKNFPDNIGLYFIGSANKEKRYFGEATKKGGIRQRFRDRMKTFKDFGIKGEDKSLVKMIKDAKIEIDCYELEWKGTVLDQKIKGLDIRFAEGSPKTGQPKGEEQAPNAPSNNKIKAWGPTKMGKTEALLKLLEYKVLITQHISLVGLRILKGKDPDLIKIIQRRGRPTNETKEIFHGWGNIKFKITNI